MKGKRRTLSYLALAVIFILMILSFVNQIYGFLADRKTKTIAYDPAELGRGYAEILDTATLEQPRQPEIGYECRPVSLNNVTSFDGVPGVRSCFEWGWQLFDQDPSEYSEALAVAAVSIINAEYWLGYDYTEDDVRAIRDGLGFSRTEIINSGDAMNVDRPVTIISSVKAEFPEGERYIVCVDIRGTYSVGDALTDIKAAHNGFSVAAEDVAGNIRRYVASYCADVSPEDIAFFVMGHSMGGACAGLQARLLDEAGYDAAKTFIYTIASPKYRLNGGRNAYPNVKNLIISKDFVPRVPFLDGRYGEDIRYDDPFPAITAGDALEIMLNARPDNELLETLVAHHSSYTYLIEVCEQDYAEESVWADFIFFNAKLLFQTMQLATE